MVLHGGLATSQDHSRSANIKHTLQRARQELQAACPFDLLIRERDVGDIVRGPARLDAEVEAGTLSYSMQ